MYQHLRCVALRTIKYDDRKAIVNAWSAERGRIGFVVPGGNTREACRRRALLMPLSLFEGEADIKPGHELYNIRDVRPMAILPSLTATPSKSVVAMFLAEVLEKVLRDTPADPLLAEYIFESVRKLDGTNTRGVANFPLIFLCRLSAFLGIEPDAGAWTRGCIFDMSDGVYRRSAPVAGRWLHAEDAAVAALLQRMDFRSGERLFLDRRVRREALDRILEYYTIHLTALDSLRSLTVVRELS